MCGIAGFIAGRAQGASDGRSTRRGSGAVMAFHRSIFRPSPGCPEI